MRHIGDILMDSTPPHIPRSTETMAVGIINTRVEEVAVDIR